MIRAHIILIVVFFTFLISLFYHKKFLNTQLKYFIYFISYVFISEVIANILMLQNVSTVIINNIYFTCSTFFYLVFYSLIFTKNKFKKVSYFFIVLFLVTVIFNTFVLQNIIDTLQTYSLILGLFLVTILIILFFTEIMNSDKVLVLKKLFMFWISIGVLIFNIGLIPVLVVAELIHWSGIYNYIILFLNIIMYSCFIAGFIISKKELNV